MSEKESINLIMFSIVLVISLILTVFVVLPDIDAKTQSSLNRISDVWLDRCEQEIENENYNEAIICVNGLFKFKQVGVQKK